MLSSCILSLTTRAPNVSYILTIFRYQLFIAVTSWAVRLPVVCVCVCVVSECGCVHHDKRKVKWLLSHAHEK